MYLPTKEAINIAEFLNDLILRHGCPDVAISDQGTEFCNQVCPHIHYQANVTLQCSKTSGCLEIYFKHRYSIYGSNFATL